ncbi:RNA polymerase sigma-70 factor (family 1) [Pedobacter africanus]|uniref:RNA polymerase sigma-70 factor (ECF subfamily) n=1 Tax=Pedobacter africanus TaxID=151894 RepID=A0ACC6KVJ1_9SPHI|nr:RNA polymerase sigma-70 factor [Pedobacter africanus]MDR6783259.1 RNA polymerase sigma-70 factor (ECF subfamily) [Pedobacter africanus]
MVAYTEYTDQELSSLLQQGDHAAFTEIYNRYWRKIFVVAHKRLGDQEEAEGIVQDLFLNLWRKRESFQLTTGFQNYFAIALKFEILDVMRKWANVSKYENELSFTYTEADESMLRAADLEELRQKIQLTISALPEKCQLVFRLKHEQGYSQKQIAEEMNISEKTVEAHLAKAKKQLRGKMGGLLELVLFLCF